MIKYPSELELQKMIFESPSLLPGVEGPVAAAREFRCDFGSIDVVVVDLSGQIIVCECKTAQKQDLRRKVVGQIFAGGITWIEVAGDAARLEQWLETSALPVRVVDGQPAVRAIGIGEYEFR